MKSSLFLKSSEGSGPTLFTILANLSFYLDLYIYLSIYIYLHNFRSQANDMKSSLFLKSSEGS